MEQRTLRLGDILDDYCPRERRVTNHAVVAMIEENVKQTRCTTCDAEHAYKGGKAPRRKKKDAGVVLYEEVLAGMPEATEGHIAQPPAIAEVPVAPVTAEADQPVEPPEKPEREEPPSPVEEGPFHRRLIRATLPRPEGQKEVRQVTDFTIRQNNGREGHNPYRAGGSRGRSFGSGSGNGNGHGNGHGNGQGNRPQGGRRFGGGAPGGSPGMPGARGPRPAGGRPGFGSGSQQRQGGPSTGSGHGRPSTGSGHGRKRSR